MDSKKRSNPSSAYARDFAIAVQQGPVLQKSVCWIWTASVKYLSIMTIQLCAGRVVRSSHPCWLKISYCLERDRIFFISGLTQNKFCISKQPWARSPDVSAISEISSRVKSRIESRCGFRKSSSSISRSGALKLLKNTSKLEFSSFFIDYRL